MKEQVTILIPLFGRDLSISEVASLMSCNEHLSNFPITFIKGESDQNTATVEELCPSADFVSFDDRYFNSRYNYSKLLLSEELYAHFGWSKYLFINELNAIINRNELAYWCRQGFDFIQGVSPERAYESFTDTVSRRLSTARYILSHQGSLSEYEKSNGLSLRLVETCWQHVKRNKRTVASFLASRPEATNDTLYWEYYINRWWPQLTTPTDIIRSRFIQQKKSTEAAGNLHDAFATAQHVNKRPSKA